ncbi:sensor histidine kinase [Jidongwangia harbinensis]|uniref:sensor histidine kinase n=1 Tax=Jidongwangia harbinensis TaxID=2878561 RepID=UPI001CD9C798|nr:histidine kinase [Jidongwangia harbinensis]MCA2212067.1 histidine kinase [Jidongwangia harbinensis]
MVTGEQHLSNVVRWFRSRPPGHQDLAIAAVVAVLSFTPGLADKGTAVGWATAQRPFGPVAAGLVLAHALSLVVRSRAPGLCLATASAAFFAYQILGYRPTFATAALYLALYSAGMLQSRLRTVTVLAWLAAYAGMTGWLVHAGSPFPPRDYVLFLALPAGCWALGRWSRGRLRAQARRHEQRAAEDLHREREHLARELHDVVTHHVTAMVMQADAALYVPAGDRAELEAGLTAIGTTGRRALGDLRELLGVLHPGHDAGPASKEPTVGRLADLVEQTRAAGQPVEFVEEPSTTAAEGLTRLAVYRVVQEGLTNALKHAPGRRTVVHLTAPADGGVVVRVSTDGGPAPAPGRPAAPSGRGLDGLRRRVSLAGGEFTASRSPGGGFLLHARFPMRTDS